MRSTQLDRDHLRLLVQDTLLAPDFRRATFGGVARGKAPCPWVRVVVRPVELRGRPYLQFSYFDQKKNVTKNLPESEIGSPLQEILEAGFARIHLSTRTEEVDIQTTKKGKLLVGRRQVEPLAPEPLQPHNRIKTFPFPEGRADRVLEALGILTRDGRVRPTMRAKYTQIN